MALAEGRAARLFAAFAIVCLLLQAVSIASWPGVVGHRLDASVWLVLLVPASAITVLLLARLPRHGVTRTLVVYVGAQLLDAGPWTMLQGLVGQHGPLMTRGDDVLWLGTLPVLPVLITLFPDGFARGPWRRVLQAQLVALGALAVISAARPSPPPRPLEVVTGVLAGVLVLSGLGSALALAWRAVTERSTRAELAPFAVVVVFAIILWLTLPSLERLVTLPSGAGGGLPFLAVIELPPLGLGYAVLRRQLFGLDVVVRRVAIAALVSTGLVAAYLGAALALATITGVSREALSAALLPATLIAIVLMPAYRGAARMADRRLYGDRRDPLALLSSLADELARTTPDDVPARVVTAVSTSLRLPWVGLLVDREGHWVQIAEAGHRVEGQQALEFPLAHAGEQAGRLCVQPRRGEQQLGRLDRRVLSQLAVQLGPAAAAIRLVDELTLSRDRLVTSREAERARLRRELHDGLSPSLAGMSLAAQAAQRKLPDDTASAERLLGTIAEESTSAWHVVRSILDDLRPPGLDELGLVGAIEERGRQLTRDGEFSVDVCGEQLPALPPRIEIALYRIATEAMTNAARHSAAAHCKVVFDLGRTLRCTVVDDGRGIPDDHGVGLGLSTMAERAAELGGSLSVVALPDGGTEVVAELPLVAT
jgi:signal transduction histidine kinase